MPAPQVMPEGADVDAQPGEEVNGRTGTVGQQVFTIGQRPPSAAGRPDRDLDHLPAVPGQREPDGGAIEREPERADPGPAQTPQRRIAGPDPGGLAGPPDHLAGVDAQ